MLVKWRRLMHAASHLAAEVPGSGRPLLVLNPQVVETALSKCHSDVVALSLFLWCARQPEYFHGSKSFDSMVRVVDRLTNRFGSVSGILSELERVGCRKKPQIFLVLMRIYWRGGMHRLVLEAFDEMSANHYIPSVFARNIALDALFKIGCIQRAFDIFNDTPSPNFLTFKLAIRNLCDLDDCLGARAVFRIMIKLNFHPDDETLTRFLICLEKSGRLTNVLELAGFMLVSGKRLSLSVWTILIDTFCQLGRVDYAYHLLGKMINAGCSPSIITYTAVIKGFLECKLPEKAFDLLHFVLSSGFELDLVLCNVLIDFLCKSKNYDDAVELLLRLREQNLKPDTYTLPSLMGILSAYGRIDLIPKFIAVLEIPFDLVACNSLMHILCKAGFPSEAVNFYDELVESGYRPDNYSFAALLSSLCRLGRVDEAVRVYNGILLSDNSVDAPIHTVVFNGLVRGRKPHIAISLFKKAVNKKFCLDMDSYKSLIYGMFRSGGSDEACNFLCEMKQLGWDLGMPTYFMMVHRLLMSGKFGAVKCLLRFMADSKAETHATEL